MKHVFIIALMGVGMCVFSCSLSDAIGQNVGGLKQSKDVPGLMRLLRHHDGRIRS